MTSTENLNLLFIFNNKLHLKSRAKTHKKGKIIFLLDKIFRKHKNGICIWIYKFKISFNIKLRNFKNTTLHSTQH